MTKKKYCKCEEKLEKREIEDAVCLRCGLPVEPNVLKLLRYYNKNRQVWKINPQTRVEKNKKKYDRSREKRKTRKRINKELEDY